MKPEFLLVLSTCPDAVSAERLAGILVDQGLAACVNFQSGIQSVYRWQGKTEHANEYLLLIKTVAARYDEVEACIKANHAYELPEILAVPIVAGSKEYLAGIDKLTSR
jgi:periplasmic divalent cation tolerance protein